MLVFQKTKPDCACLLVGTAQGGRALAMLTHSIAEHHPAVVAPPAYASVHDIAQITRRVDRYLWLLACLCADPDLP